MSADTVVDDIAHALSVRILHRELPAQARLPSVRALAQEYAVNVSTIQRVLVQLEERGLVIAHSRAGVTVLDAERSGGCRLWPVLMREAIADPDRALALLEDSLAARRVLAVDVLRTLSRRRVEEYLPELEATLDVFASLAAAEYTDFDALYEADSEVLRGLLIAARRPAALAILNEVQAMIGASPSLVEASYDQPAQNLGAWQTLLGLLRGGPGAARLEEVAAALEALDARALETFAASLGVAMPAVSL